MTVYIDELKRYPFKISSGRRSYENEEWCHMIADTLDELLEMAQKIGMKMEWLQDHGSVVHFDLMKNKRNLALKNGAVFKTAREQARERIAERKAAKEAKEIVEFSEVILDYPIPPYQEEVIKQVILKNVHNS